MTRRKKNQIINKASLKNGKKRKIESCFALPQCNFICREHTDCYFFFQNISRTIFCKQFCLIIQLEHSRVIITFERKIQLLIIWVFHSPLKMCSVLKDSCINLAGSALDKTGTERIINTCLLFLQKMRYKLLQREQKASKFLVWWFSEAKQMVKDKNLLGNRKETNFLVFIEIRQRSACEPRRRMIPKPSLLMNNYLFGCCQILQPFHWKGTHTSGRVSCTSVIQP